MMMSDSKQQFVGSFLSNDLNVDEVKSDFVKSDSAKIEAQAISGSLLDGVVVFPDGSVMWVPCSDVTEDIGEEAAMQGEMSLPYANRLPRQSYVQNRNHRALSAVALIKRMVRRRVMSFQRVLR
ncbi:MAG: hypothetical protein HC840_16395 [Leptolyngbyaceae cyanobacterium RM2_2_4]|nr:hypothetical protein [Leptolyngbyaceae cyanobacterium RM2_2_4]